MTGLTIKRETLEICLELWTWLSQPENNFKRKDQWPGWEKHGEMQSNCPCCEYTLHFRNESCSKCLLIRFWDNDPFHNAPCVWNGPYAYWCEEKTSEAAQGMVDIIRQALAELKD